MNLRQRIIITVVFIAIAVLVYFFLPRDGAESAINTRLDTFIERLEKNSPETELVSLGEGRDVARFFTESPVFQPGVRYAGNRLTSRDQIASMIAYARIQAETIEVSASNRSLDVAETKDRAVMRLTGEAEALVGGQRERMRNRYEITWIKQDGDWYIDKVILLDD